MKVNEYFVSLQGEGPSVGKPSFFLRLFGCNLNCKFCDTKYSRVKMNYVDIKWYLIYDKILDSGVKNIVITGGEPLMMHPDRNELLSLVRKLHKSKNKFTIEIETNGTYPPFKEKFERLRYNISPKLSNSGNKKKDRYKPTNLRKFKKHNHIFKFVASRKHDILEIRKIQRELKIKDEKIYLMPLTIDGQPESILNHGPILYKYCMKYNWTMSMRLHVFLNMK